MKHLLLALGLSLLLISLEVSAIRVRCGILSIFGKNNACSASCWVRGKKKGESSQRLTSSKMGKGVMSQLQNTGFRDHQSLVILTSAST